MNLLFISMSARTAEDDKGNLYLNHHMNEKTIKRYADICNSFRMILRDGGIRCSEEAAKKKYNLFPNELAQVDVCFNPYSPVKNLVNLHKRKEMKQVFKRNIQWADRVIIASPNGIYSTTAIRYCEEFNKKYMLLVGGFSFEVDWFHDGVKGKIVALKREIDTKRNIRKAPYVLYVTERSLQKRYPSKGKTIGCSDVEITDLSPAILEKRLAKINGEHTLVLGTMANIDLALKGQRLVIKAISLLKSRGYRVEYRLLGGGTEKKLLEYANKCGVSDQIIMEGVKPHYEVYEWLDGIDIYVQPSFTEGLCRAVVEAMSRACPVVCTDTGGNNELCSPEYLVKTGDPSGFAKAIERLFLVEERKKQAKISFDKAYNYYCEPLDKRREEFMLDFMK